MELVADSSEESEQATGSTGASAAVLTEEQSSRRKQRRRRLKKRFVEETLCQELVNRTLNPSQHFRIGVAAASQGNVMVLQLVNQVYLSAGYGDTYPIYQGESCRATIQRIREI